MELSEKKSLLRTKEEEYKFLEDGMKLLHKEFSHWKKRLSLYKRRTRFGELICELSRIIRKSPAKNKSLLDDIRDTNKCLERQLGNKVKLNIVEMKEKINGLIQVYEDLREPIRALEQKKVQLNIQISERERQIQTMELIQMYPLRFYGKEMETLKKILIENSKEFWKEPKGPLGTLITVKMANWVAMVERILDPFLFIFMVDNRQDAARLEEYINQVYGKFPVTSGYPVNMTFMPVDIDPLPRRPEVWITSFSQKPFDFSKTGVVDSQYPTLMDMLDFQDEDVTVKNTLGKFSQFEKILLFNNEHEAFSELANCKRVPKNCIVGYTKEFFKVNPFPSFGTTIMEKKSTLGMLLRPSTAKTCSLLLEDVKKLTFERDEMYHRLLKVERAKQLDVVLEIEALQKKCIKLKGTLVNIKNISQIIECLCEEIFNSNAAHLASFIMKGDAHEDHYNKARVAALGMTVLAKKRAKLERIIGKMSADILSCERELVNADESLTYC